MAKKNSKSEQTTIKVRKETHQKVLAAQAKLILIRQERVSVTETYDLLISAAIKYLKVDQKDLDGTRETG